LLVTKDAKQAAYQTENTGVEESQYDMLKRLELSYADFRELKAYCDQKGILFISTPDENESADFLYSLQDIFKVGSAELTNIPFLKHIGAFRKRVILSTGMGSLGEVEKALDTIIEAGTSKENIILLHVTTQYPTPMEDVNLTAMLTLKEAFKIRVGYSDHTMGIEVPIAAVALGAEIIEKHFTLSREMEGPDHKASLEPNELKQMVNSIRNIEKALGDGIKRPVKSEVFIKKHALKSIVAKNIIKKGEIFSDDNITTRRAGNGLSATYWDLVIGKSAIRNFNEGENIEL
jgi:N-acetylneuraminate synthase